MNDDEDPIDKALGINTPMITQYENTISNMISLARNDSASEDFTFARANIREVVENGNEALNKLALIAEQSQNPRAFEVLAKLMDTMIAANRELLEIQKKIRELDKADAPRDEAAKSITNNLFVGSTAELQKALREIRENGNT